MTREQRNEEIRRLREEGVSVREIARRLRVGRDTIYKVCEPLPEPPAPKPGDRFQVRELWGWPIHADTWNNSSKPASVSATVIDTGHPLGPAIVTYTAHQEGSGKRAVARARRQAAALNRKYRPLDAAIGIVW